MGTCGGRWRVLTQLSSKPRGGAELLIVDTPLVLPYLVDKPMSLSIINKDLSKRMQGMRRFENLRAHP